MNEINQTGIPSIVWHVVILLGLLFFLIYFIAEEIKITKRKKAGISGRKVLDSIHEKHITSSIEQQKESIS